MNLGVYSFLSVLALSLAFLCCFMFISAFLRFYSLFFSFSACSSVLLPSLPIRKRRFIKWPGFFLRRRIFSLKRMSVLAKYHVIDFGKIHWLRGNIPLRTKDSFFQSVALTLLFYCLYERSTIIMVEMFSDMCFLEDNPS